MPNDTEKQEMRGLAVMKWLQGAKDLEEVATILSSAYPTLHFYVVRLSVTHMLYVEGELIFGGVR